VRRVKMAKIGEAKVVTTDVFEMGSIPWKSFNLDTSAPSSPPTTLLIFTPTVPAAYTVIVFYHGFFIPPSYYTQLLSRIVSHGFIVVAPQLVYTFYFSLLISCYNFTCFLRFIL